MSVNLTVDGSVFLLLSLSDCAGEPLPHSTPQSEKEGGANFLEAPGRIDFVIFRIPCWFGISAQTGTSILPPTPQASQPRSLTWRNQRVRSATEIANCSSCCRATIGIGSFPTSGIAGAFSKVSSMRFRSSPPPASLPLKRLSTSWPSRSGQFDNKKRPAWNSFPAILATDQRPAPVAPRPCRLAIQYRNQSLAPEKFS